MGYIAPLSIQFKSTNTFEQIYDCIITLTRRGKTNNYLLLEINGPYL